MLDVVIVGGSSAGLSAGLYLGRMRRTVAVFDTGQPCNRYSHAAHGFLTRDHVPPAELLQIAREQLARYDTVHFLNDKVVKIEVKPKPNLRAFTVHSESGAPRMARKVVLATGIRDELPAIPGLEPLFGRSVFTCPFCDGWEQHDQPVAILGNGEEVNHTIYLLRNLTADLVLCTNGPATLNKTMRARIEAKGVRIIETPVASVTSEGEQLREIVFADGSRLPRHALFVRTTMTQHADLAIQLGCTINQAGFVQVDDFGRTNIPGLYAAGDMTTPMRQIILAAKSGASAAFGINADFIAEEVAAETVKEAI
jgi:thioredoxin reductase